MVSEEKRTQAGKLDPPFQKKADPQLRRQILPKNELTRRDAVGFQEQRSEGR